MIERIAVIGAGAGGKTAAADLALQGVKVRLYEFPEFKNNLDAVSATKTLTASGAVAGEARLEAVTSDLAEALAGVDTAMVCTQALAHERAARELAPFADALRLVVLNPGSTGGALVFAKAFRKYGVKQPPILVETATLTYGCRAAGATVSVSVKANRVLYGTLPAAAIETVGTELEAFFPGLRRAATVLEAGLNNANPVIHPPIVILNAARIENEGDRNFFYGDGISPMVARLIRKLDEERMALLAALGYPAQSDPETSVAQGYAESTDYHDCYKTGSAFGTFRFPNTLDNRYFHEDVGMGLVLFRSLGRLLDVPTPACDAVIRMSEVLTGIDYTAQAKRTAETLGIAHLDKAGLKAYLETGRMAGD